MTRADVAIATAVIALVLALAGLVALITGTAVVEVLCVEAAGVVVAVLSAGLFISDTLGRS